MDDDSEMSMFDRSLGELTDDEIRIGLLVVSERRNELAEAGRHGLAELLNAVAVLLAGERDARVELARAVDAATAKVTPLCD